MKRIGPIHWLYPFLLAIAFYALPWIDPDSSIRWAIPSRLAGMIALVWSGLCLLIRDWHRFSAKRSAAKVSIALK